MLEDNKTDANGNGVPDLCERKQENSRGNVSGNEKTRLDFVESENNVLHPVRWLWW